MEGILRKKNSRGVWQQRYFIINNSNLFYKTDKMAREIKGTIDLKSATSVKPAAKGFEIDMSSAGKGDENMLLLKCTPAETKVKKNNVIPLTQTDYLSFII